MGEYRVPSMKEIQELPWNGYNVVSTFSGGGGSCTGYEMAGYHVVWANEFIPAAQDTYEANHPTTHLNRSDIREITAEQVLSECGLKRGEIDIFDGSPPCATFSTAGKREKSWGKQKSYSDTTQRVDDLFFEYARLLEGLQPKTFVAENVSGLVKGKAKGYFKQIIRSLKECGYEVSARLLNAKYLGVPQSRERLIFVGVRKDLCEKFGVSPVHPRPLKQNPYTLRDAFEGLPPNDLEEMRLSKELEGKKALEIIKQMPKNPSKPFGGDKIMGEGHWFNLVRLSMECPSNTVCQSHGTAGFGGVVHPNQDRKLTISEVKRIMSLPDDYVLTGDYKQQYERCGRMVPPVMMMHIAKTIEEEVLCKISEG